MAWKEQLGNDSEWLKQKDEKYSRQGRVRNSQAQKLWN